MLPACRLVQLARRFRSSIRMTVGSKVAEATSILSILLLCATMNAPIDIEVSGADEQDALRAVEAFFQADA